MECAKIQNASFWELKKIYIFVFIKNSSFSKNE